MSKVKCIIRQSWTTRDACGNLIERKNCVYVTNEDGTPHVYNSIAEARAEIVANYGRDANRAGILHSHAVDDYTGRVHDGYIYIVREDTEEFAAATERAAVEAVAADMLKEHGNEEDARNAAAYGVFADLHDGARPDTLSYEDMAQLDRLMMYAADAVARALIDAYAEAIGEHPTEDDPETRAAYAVAHDESATDEDRETVASMMQAIADHAERQQVEATAAARIAAAALLDAYATAEGISPADVTPEQSAAAYAVAAVEIIPEADRPAGYTTATADDRATVDAMTERIAQAAADDMPTVEAPIYQRHELVKE